MTFRELRIVVILKLELKNFQKLVHIASDFKLCIENGIVDFKTRIGKHSKKDVPDPVVLECDFGKVYVNPIYADKVIVALGGYNTCNLTFTGTKNAIIVTSEYGRGLILPVRNNRS